jgi:glycosyltransferase involved in cell wall biosynthesis
VNRWPRVAFFSDSFLEVNGVAHTSRCLAAVARKRGLPFLAVFGGNNTRHTREGLAESLELRRSAFSFRLDHDLRHDLLFWRHFPRALAAANAFQPDLVHITGPGDLGITGARVAYALRVPLVASWHTNLHEYAGRRLVRLLCYVPGRLRARLGDVAERLSWRGCVRFYKLARVLLAPNPELAERLNEGTGKPVFLMHRGVDTEFFSPAKRDAGDGPFRLGYVGRLSTEKNVRMLAEIERELAAAGAPAFEFLIVGEGAERAWLEQNVAHARFTGVLQGEPLAHAYASMDAFVFPSKTETFGNVVLEALASGVPALVSPRGGARFQVTHGVTGFVADSASDFARHVLSLMRSPELLRRAREAARLYACQASWERVLDEVLLAYGACLPQHSPARGASLLAVAG